ncbi:phytoene/squalene synthase family protein [Fructobacillus parabroussonetiae]|uniref:Phytoene/squalene synthase family protein n=1 Tax=Fructobacillus parabroussonetiae TaxID=2713174 RepID=A0ABS5QWD1_9LACO|nr:phytoene/squalene synthase family protein [Fructobacillus parabroussonetiae]MBS9337518.1 phytoene/squalene synthase family protein [Fructobacillus parabroussonetiae]
MKLKQQMPAPVLQAFESSEGVIKENSSSFYFAFSRLPREQAYSIFVIYEFLRELDDTADEHKPGCFDEMVTAWQNTAEQTFTDEGNFTSLAEKVAYVFDFYQINRDLMADMIAGQQHDLNFQQPKTLAELEDYCYQVAGTVGCMIFTILSGKTELTEQDQVIKVGIALQLTNILRDLHEDAEEGRLFMPQELLDNSDKNPFMAVQLQSRERQVVRKVAQAAMADYEHTDFIVNEIENPQSRFALKLSIEIYKKILLKLLNGGFTDISKRMYVTKWEKIQILVRTYFWLRSLSKSR